MRLTTSIFYYLLLFTFFRFLKLFTEVPLDQIKKFEHLEGSELNDVKVLLADEATKLLHGEECLKDIHATVKTLFSRSGGDDLESLPKIQLTEKDFTKDAGSSIPVFEILVLAEMTSSKAEARRLIKKGGAKINDVKIDDEYAVVNKKDFDHSGRLKVSSGKKKHAVVLLPVV